MTIQPNQPISNSGIPQSQSPNRSPIINQQESYATPLFVTREGYVDIFEWGQSKNLSRKDTLSLIKKYGQNMSDSDPDFVFEISRVGNKRMIALTTIDQIFNTQIHNQRVQHVRNVRARRQTLSDKRDLYNFAENVLNATNMTQDQIIRTLVQQSKQNTSQSQQNDSQTSSSQNDSQS